MKNGPLRFVSMADRALDVCQFEYRGENLVLRRTITSVYGRLSITVEDEVTNESFRDDQSRKRVPARARRRRERPQLRRRGQPQARTRSRHRLRRQPLPILHGMESTGAGDYVVGLEPSNSSVHGRGWHEQRGDLHAIAPQASERKSLTFTVIEGEAAIDGLIARRDALLG